MTNMKPKDQTPPQNRLIEALAAGAAARLRPNLRDRHESQTPITDAYQQLKDMLEAAYGQVEVDLLDIGPGSSERQQVLAQQLEEAGATEDEAILRQAQRLLDIIAAENPAALWASDEPESPPHLR